MNLFEKKRLARSKDKDMVFKFLDARSEKTGFFSSLFDIYTFAIALVGNFTNILPPLSLLAFH